MRLHDPADDPMRSVVDYDRDEKRSASRHVVEDVSERQRVRDELSPEERAGRRGDKP